jgi:hypothetical protein
MQLTKDDLKRCYGEPERFIYFSKFLQVRKFYENYKDGKNQPPYDLWKEYMKCHLEHNEVLWSDWLFKHCFEDGLK